jgi:hypothetical protein
MLSARERARELASDEQIRRNASQAGGPFNGLRVTAATITPLSDEHASPGVPAAGELFIDFHMAGIGSRSGGKVDSGGSVRQRRDFPFLAEV